MSTRKKYIEYKKIEKNLLSPFIFLGFGFWFCLFEFFFGGGIGFYDGAQVVLELIIFLPQLPRC